MKRAKRHAGTTRKGNLVQATYYQYRYNSAYMLSSTVDYYTIHSN